MRRGMVSFEVEGSGEDARRLSEAMRLFTLAPSLGGVESLVSIPVLTSHLTVPPEETAEDWHNGADDPALGWH